MTIVTHFWKFLNVMVCGQTGAIGMELQLIEEVMIHLLKILVGMLVEHLGELHGIIFGLVQRAVKR